MKAYLRNPLTFVWALLTAVIVASWAWLTALAAGFIVEFVLYSSLPLFFRVATPGFYAAGLLALWMRCRSSGRTLGMRQTIQTHVNA